MAKLGVKRKIVFSPALVMKQPKIKNAPYVLSTMRAVEVEPSLIARLERKEEAAIQEARELLQSKGYPEDEELALCAFYGGGKGPRFGRRKKRSKEGMPTLAWVKL
ncbi:MAG: hypothetical protein Q7T16_04565 [Candidatus Burarchaeum sp.]|nr:hypothetical protein [Candidatus Burarchaeum sp.]MDO8339901.1 hypothetical protein [Candidatus Burarchaeum sp.]